MIFKSDNYMESLKIVGLFPLISIPLFWATYTVEGITAKIICGILGLFFFIGPILLFSWDRYEVRLEDDGIKVNFTNKRRKNLVFAYEELITVTFVPLNVQFTFQISSGKKKSFLVYKEIKDLSAFIQYLRSKNDNIHYNVSTYDGEDHKFVMKELKKKLDKN